MEADFHIVILDENPVRAEILREGLSEAGHRRVTRLETSYNLEDRLERLAPDIVLIALENPSRDVLEQMIRLSGARARPVAMFVDQSDGAMIASAIDAGVSAYVVDGLKKERVKSIVDLSISRFNAFARLREELETAKTQLADRKIIDQAKGLLMKSKNIPEDQAYALLRKTAMNEGKKIADIARALVLAAELMR